MLSSATTAVSGEVSKVKLRAEPTGVQLPTRISDVNDLRSLTLDVLEATIETSSGKRSFRRHVNPGGGMGGFVERTAEADPTAIVEENALVIDFAKAKEFARVCNHSILMDRSYLGGHASTAERAMMKDMSSAIDFAVIYGDACLMGLSRAMGSSQVFGDAIMYDHSVAREHAKVHDNARLHDFAEASGFSDVGGSTNACGQALLRDHCTTRGGKFGGRVIVEGHILIAGGRRYFGDRVLAAPKREEKG